jgi:hypothetical protein
VHGALADDGHRHALEPERLQITPALGLVLDVEAVELHSP